jgi:hypothetical protein
MERDPAIRRLARALAPVAAWACLLAGPAGCGILAEERQQDVTEVSLAAFSTPPKGAVPEVVEIPMAQVEPPAVTEVTETEVLGDGSKVTSRKELVTAVDPATQKVTTQSIDQGVTQTVRIGQRWPVESLVGQINGRPIFANDFFRASEARILNIVANPNQQAAKAQLEALVHENFVRKVNSELVLAEAESRLSPEMKQGVLAWLRQLQEQTIAQRGGSRSSAEETLRDEEGMGIDDYVRVNKEKALASDLLRRKVAPRVIVSWRDIERRYDQNRAMYAPDPTYKVARISLTKDAQADKIATVRRMLAEKRPFTEIATAVGVPKEGAWQEFRVTDGKMQLGDLADDLRAALEKLVPGMVSGEIERRTTIVWLSIVGAEIPPSASIFEPLVQLSIRGQLMGERDEVEQAAYLASLRRRWLSSSIAKMELRLQKMARDRYLDPTKQLAR